MLSVRYFGEVSNISIPTISVRFQTYFGNTLA